VITAAGVLAGNAPDNTDALELVQETSRNTGCEVAKVIGDCAYGDGVTRREFKEQGCELVVKVPRGGRPGYFAKGKKSGHFLISCVSGAHEARVSSVQSPVSSNRNPGAVAGLGAMELTISD
jgi:hypothetical protein